MWGAGHGAGYPNSAIAVTIGFGARQTIDVNRFAPGDYTLRYTVIDAIAEQSFRREAPLRIGD
jgi:hypothetical protein